MRLRQFLWHLKELVAYLRAAVDEHGVHSPFVYSLLTKVLRHESNSIQFAEIEVLRKNLRSDNSEIEITDLGAGSVSTGKSRKRKISEVCTTSSISRKKGQLLARLVEYFSPKVVLELGTNLGLGTLYQALAYPQSKVYTIEGCPNLHHLAASHFTDLQAGNIIAVHGDFDSELPKLLSTVGKVDFAFLDGNHTYEATVKYFNLLLPYLRDQSLVVLDDIRWSEGMKNAWNEIVDNPKVSISIDFYSVGLVFFRPGVVKQHFILK